MGIDGVKRILLEKLYIVCYHNDRKMKGETYHYDLKRTM